MRLWFDEDLSPTLVQVAHQRGCDATCNRDRNMLGATDEQVARAAQDEDFVLATDNAADFRKLYARTDVHPGILVMPASVPRSRQQELTGIAIDWIDAKALEAGEDATDWMINRKVHVPAAGGCTELSTP